MSNEIIKAILVECEKGEGRSIEMRVTGRHDQVAILSKDETTLAPIEPGKNPPDGVAVYLMTPEAVEFRVGNKTFLSDDLFISKKEE